MSSEAKDVLPKLGKVTEICQEWMVREDGAMAYRLQNQEINQHYKGNKQRNALVREDFPRARSEQQKEQELAEQAAAVYQKMLQEQEEMDNLIAQQLAEKLKMEERAKRRAAEVADQNYAKQLIERERQRKEELLVQRAMKPPPPREDRRFVARFAGPVAAIDQVDVINSIVPEDEAKRSQEEADAELARQLQEQEGSLEETLMQRDRLLAIEAQDKELAKILQERERVKARKAKERAKQKSLAKKQQQMLQQQQLRPENADQLLPDDAYSYPVDLIPPREQNSQLVEYEDNYSLPVNVLQSKEPSSGRVNSTNNYSASCERTPPRPNYLNLKYSHKPRYPDPEEITPSNQHVNIAMAIDPTYSKYDNFTSPKKRSPSSTPGGLSTPGSLSTPSSTSGMLISTLEHSDDDDDDDGNVPPYMPIQGQRRTSSLEKKQKKKSREGCKQQ